MEKKTRRKGVVAAIAGILILLTFLGLQFGGALDVVAREGKISFGEVAGLYPSDISKDAVKGFRLNSRLGDLFGLRYIPTMEGDFATTGMEGFMEVDGKEFLRAGLDPERLMSKVVSYSPENGTLLIRRTLKDIPRKDFRKGTASDMTGLMKLVLDSNRKVLGYHMDLEHFGFNFGEGFTFEWAKDEEKNDKDLVWVLNAEPLIAAGLNVDSLETWIFLKDKNKLIRAFDLE